MPVQRFQRITSRQPEQQPQRLSSNARRVPGSRRFQRAGNLQDSTSLAVASTIPTAAALPPTVAPSRARADWGALGWGGQAVFSLPMPGDAVAVIFRDSEYVHGWGGMVICPLYHWDILPELIILVKATRWAVNQIARWRTIDTARFRLSIGGVPQ